MMRRLTILLLATGIALLLLISSALAAPSAIFTAQSTGQRGFIDPIVSPGQRSAHEHCFYGAVGVEQTETSASLRAKPTTWVETDNHTAIWIPCVYEDGRLLQPFSSKHLLAYYKPIAGSECVPPEDMAGVSREYGYRGQTGGGAFSLTPPASTSQGVLVVTIFWRGARDFGVGCFPTVQAYIRLNVGVGSIGNITLGGPSLSSEGAMGPTSMHGDYFFGWDRAAFERFLARCVRPGVACGTNPAI
jgi:uncharacterized protein DUF1996